MGPSLDQDYECMANENSLLSGSPKRKEKDELGWKRKGSDEIVRLNGSESRETTRNQRRRGKLAYGERKGL